MKNLSGNEYHLFYEMMMQSLKIDNVEDGVARSLDLLKSFLKAQNVILYKKNNKEQYLCKISDSSVNEILPLISSIVEKTNHLIETKELFSIDLNISNKLKNIMSIFIKEEDKEYILLINTYDTSKIDNQLFWGKLKDTMHMILKRALIYEKNIKAISIDLLTGLDNRNSYENKISEIMNSDEEMVFAIFDLFRLKHINDNYTHAIGDIYIKETASVLNKYWPKYNTSVVNYIEENKETGHYLYRVGGDEFILITNKEKIDVTKIKANLALEEIKLINLPIKNKPVLGLNSGITIHKPGSLIKETYIYADEIMREDKKEMYLKYGIERRL